MSKKRPQKKKKKNLNNEHLLNLVSYITKLKMRQRKLWNA